jgi:hypothetical protein
MHTVYSDGTGTHQDIADAALQAGIDAVIVTDHNVWVQDLEGYYSHSGKAGLKDHRKVLVLVGEEVHNPLRQPQKSHLLVFGAGREVAPFGNDPQRLVDQVGKLGGLVFIAHPYDPELPAFHEPDISWEDWDVRGYHGIELWNGFSEMKNTVKTRLQGIFHVYFPQLIAHGPLPQALHKWDELTASGQRVVAVGGSDAHALKLSLGPLHRTVFPYSFHFKAVNTHVIIERELTQDLAQDRQMVLDALRKGHAFVGYDLPAPTLGFRFTAQAKDGQVQMGDEVRAGNGITFQVKLPAKVECRLLRNGEAIKTWRNTDICTHIASQPGAYRVECFIDYHGKRRGWIYSNPIYVRP